MYRVVQVRVREAGKIHYFMKGDVSLEIGDHCIVEADRGLEYGEVISESELILDADTQEEPIRNVLRKATPEDEEKISKNKEEAKKAFDICFEKINTHKLPMKLIYVEYSFDMHKLVFYFSAEGRVDFRELVKDLASVFKARIELRQIGVRDEAKILGGTGCCGRPLCCATFLRDFVPVNIKMAKTQRLPLNPDKISGVCGRLLCCLKYEDETYRKCLKDIPVEGTKVVTEHGEGVVKDMNILKQTVLVDLGEDRVVNVSIKNIKIIGRPCDGCSSNTEKN
jgi:cell fate regulator YaaT (PSP1 superfamily)